MTLETFQSRLVSLSRRYAYVWHNEKIMMGKFASNQSDYIIGDIVNCYIEKGELYVSNFLERKNIFKRYYFDSEKNIACNIDRIFLMVSPRPMINTYFVDNVLCVANKEHIPVSIILNKCDLDTKKIMPILTLYKNLRIDILKTSAKTLVGIDDLKAYFDNTNEEQVLFCGLSGVGKSSILNKLIKTAENKVGELGKRGHGKQTTTQAFGFHYSSDKRDKEKQDLFIIDLPGISNFNVSFLDKYEVGLLFTDINKLSAKCEYGDCLHGAEPNCYVKKCVEDKTLAESRYLSYLSILQSIDDIKKY
ncbi:MAG: ribosome small subunit-dependent GTPase A [Bdellovibrionota bacterium]